MRTTEGSSQSLNLETQGSFNHDSFNSEPCFLKEKAGDYSTLSPQQTLASILYKLSEACQRYSINRVLYMENQARFLEVPDFTPVKAYPDDAFIELNTQYNAYNLIELSEPRYKEIITEGTAIGRKRYFLIDAFGQSGLKTRFLFEHQAAQPLSSIEMDQIEWFSHKACVEIEKHRLYKKDQVKLTPREIQVVRLIANGDTNSQIANKLSISVHTVTAYVKNIYLKTMTKDRVTLSFYAFQNGYLSE